MPHISRFKLRTSDRSGFKYYELELVKEGPWKIHPEEFDLPPPSRKPLGGEGDISASDIRSNSDFSNVGLDTATPPSADNPTFYITASGGIAPTRSHPYMRVTGSAANITIAANPKIVSGQESQVLTLLGVGSTITLTNGNGISLMGSIPYVLGLSDTITFMYNTANNAWNETSRYKGGGF